MDCSLLGSSILGIVPGKNTGVGYHFFLQGIFLTQGSNSGLLNYRQILYCLSHWGIYRVHHPKCWGGWITTWNQDCGEKYQLPQICRWYHPNGRKRRGTKEPLDEGEIGEWKSRLKTQHSKNEDHSIQSHHSMTNRWGNNGKWDFNFLGSKITADDDCSHEIKRCLFLGRKAMTNLDSILKSRDIPLTTKVYIVKAMVFPVVMNGCKSYKEGWVSKNWCFSTVVLEKTLESPLDCKIWNQSILKEISPENSLEGLMLARLQYSGHLMQRADSLEKTLILWNIEGRRRRGRQRMR